MDSVFSIQEQFPIYAVFLLILIISAAFLPTLFPCRLQNALNNSIYLKHAFSFMTMVFFVVLTIPDSEKKIFDLIPKSFLLYAFFLVLIKTEFPFFIAILVLIAIIYVLVIRRSEIHDELKQLDRPENSSMKINNNNYGNINANKSNDKQTAILSDKQKEYDTIIKINNILTICIIPLLLIGSLSYLGKKRHKYKDNFSFATFIFGKFNCNAPQQKEMSTIESLGQLFKIH